MKYHVTIDGEELEIELVERDGRTLAIHPELDDGVGVPVELVPVQRSGSYSLLVGDRSLPVVATGDEDELTLTLGSETWNCAVVDEREVLARAALGPGAARAGGGLMRSVMPGIVRDIRVAVGDTVERGQAMLILEAMKMENEIRAEVDGTVKTVHVTPGTAVAKGDSLITLE